MKSGISLNALTFLDSWLGYRHGLTEIPGLAVTIAHEGKVVFSKAYGYANLERKEKLTTGHIFRIASHSKTFTGTAIMQLAEKDKLQVDDCVIDYLPWLNRHNDKRVQKITVRQLLSHSAGLIRDGLDADYWQLKRSFPDGKQLKEAVLAADLVFDTNVQMKYSNFGFALLGGVIEKASGLNYNQYVKQNIVEALQLKNTEPEINPEMEKKLVTGYSRPDVNKSRLPIANIDTREMSAATGFCSTAEELVKYFSAHFIGSKRLLNDQSKKEMQRTQWKVANSQFNEEYGLGLVIDYVGDRRVFGHGGGFPGHRTKTFCDPKDKLIVIVMANAIEVDPAEIGKGVLSVIDHFQKNESVSKSKRDLRRFQGRLMNLWTVQDIVVVGDKVYSINPGVWQPFKDTEELEYVDEKTLKVVR